MDEVSKFESNYSKAQLKEAMRIRKIVADICPDSISCISYGIPTIKYKGKNLIHYCAFKEHYSLFPGSTVIELLKPELDNFKLSKGTIRYSQENMISDQLVEKIVKSAKLLIEKPN